MHHVADPEFILTGTSCTEQQDAVIARDHLLARLRNDPLWSSLSAVNTGKLLVLSADELMRPGPRSLDALAELKRQLSNFGAAVAVAEEEAQP